MTTIPPIPAQSDDIRSHLPTLHARFLSLQSSSSRRIGPAMAFFEPFLRRSPTLSFVRCTVCVPGPVPRAVAESVKMELSKAVRSDAGPAVSKGKVSRIRGFVARSSRTAAGGTSSLFNHAHRSHPQLLAALRDIIDRDLPNGRKPVSRIGKKKKRRIGNLIPSPNLLRIAALAASALFPPGVLPHTAKLVRELPPSRRLLVHTVWPYLRNEIRARVSKNLLAAPALGITLDRWAVAGNPEPVYAINIHFLATWKKHFVCIGVTTPVRTGVVDPRRLLETFGVRDKIFGLVSKDVPIIIDGRISDIVGDCFRAICLFSELSEAVRKVVHGEIGEHPLVLHGEAETTLEGAIAIVARCVSLVKDNPEGRLETTDITSAIQDPHAAQTQLMPPSSAAVTPVPVPQPSTAIQDLMSDGVDAGVTAATRAAAAAAAAAASEAPEAASVVADVPQVPQSPKPWLRGNIFSMLSQFEILTALHTSVHGLNDDHLQPLRDLMDEHWVVVRAITKVLSLVKENIPPHHGWAHLPDALIKIINLICAICDRLTEIELLVDQSLVPNTQLPLRQYIDEFLRTRHIRQEDAVANSSFITILEGSMLYNLLEALYPIIQPLIEYVPKQAYRIMALALDPRFCSLAVLITLNKKLMQGSRLVFEKEFHGDDADGSDERIRKRVRNMSLRYDEDVIVPLMNSVNPRFPGAASSEQAHQKVGQDAEEGLFEETFEPTDDWKHRHQLLAELAKFRSFKKNISRTASFAECLAWWENNAELFPNISTLFQKVVSVPASHAPLQRILGTANPKVNIARGRLTRSGLEDLVFIHENLSPDMLCDIQGLPRVKDEPDKGDLFDDDELFELAPELFATE